jgi:hypothetical protein
MKTSNKLIIGLFIFIFLALAGSAYTLKVQYEKIDRNNPYLGYDQHRTMPFKFVKVTGDAFEFVQIQPGNNFGIMLRNLYGFEPDKYKTWKIIGDTLFIEHTERVGGTMLFNDKNISSTMSSSPSIFVTAPTLTGVFSSRFPIKIAGWQRGALTIDLRKGAVVLDDNHFDKLTVHAQSGSYVKFGVENKFDTLNIQVKDSSRVIGRNRLSNITFGQDSTELQTEASKIR